MKTLNYNKMVAVIAVLTLTFTQIAPPGWAATDLNNIAKEKSVPASVSALTNLSAATPAPAQSNSIDFLTKNNPLSSVTQDSVRMPEPQPVPAPTPKLLPTPKPEDPTLDRISVDEKEAKEVKDILKQKPATKSSEGLCTTSIPAHCSDNTSYYDAKGNLIGQKRVSWTESEPNVQVNWYRPARNGDFVLVASYIEKRNPEVRITPEVAAVKADLLKNLGIDSKQLEVWLKEGLIKINEDAAKGTVVVSFSETLRSQYDGLKNVNLFDPTGASGLPKSITYQWAQLKICKSGEKCIGGGAVILNARIVNWNGARGLATYGNGLLSKVDWYRGYKPGEPRPMIVCKAGDFTCDVVLDRTVTYNLIASIPEDHNPVYLLITVVYHDGRAISKLEFEIGELADGNDHILSIREYDPNGKLQVTSTFKYLAAVCTAGAVCAPSSAVVQLDSIRRTDAEGQLLSTIRKIRRADLAIHSQGPANALMPLVRWETSYTADVVLADGKSWTVNFSDYAKLLEQVRKSEQEILPPAVQAIRQAVKAGLVNTFGFTQAMVDDLVKQGLIKIEVDLEHLTAKVTIDPSVKLLAGTVNLVDPLGQNQLPGEIHYKLGELMGSPCPEGVICTQNLVTVGYILGSGSFHIGDNYFVEIRYEGDRLHSVLIYDGDPTPVCDGNICAERTILPLKQLTFKYEFSDGIVRFVKVHIDYFRPDTGINTSRDIMVTNMADDQYHIQIVIDKDANGNVTANSQFQYLVMHVQINCVVKGVCEQTLDQIILAVITRTDAAGKKLSEIVGITGSEAKVKLPDIHDGLVAVQYKNLADLLTQVAELEAVREIQASPELLAQAQGILGTGVARGVALVRTNVAGNSVITKFYDEGGSFMGSYTTNPSLGPQNVPTWRDANGMEVAREIPASPELLAQAQGILGTGVVRGVALVRTNVAGDSVITKFYDAGGSFMGSYTTNPSLGPQNVPTWRDAQGNVISPIQEVDVQVRVIDPATGQTILRTLHFDLGRDNGDVYENGQRIGSFQKKMLSASIAGAKGFVEFYLEGNSLTGLVALGDDDSLKYLDGDVHVFFLKAKFFEGYDSLSWQDLKVFAQAMNWYARNFYVAGDAYTTDSVVAEVTAYIRGAALSIMAHIILKNWEKNDVLEITPSLESLFDFFRVDQLPNFDATTQRAVFSRYLGVVGGILDGLYPLGSQNPARTTVFEALLNRCRDHSDMIARLNELYEGSNSSAWHDFRATLAVLASTPAQIDEVSRLLGLSAAQKDVLKAYGVLVQSHAGIPGDAEVRRVQMNLEQLPVAMTGHLVNIILWPYSRGNFNEIGRHFGMIWTSDSKYIFFHELWHSYKLYRPEFLSQKLWMQEALFNLGNAQDRPTAYASTYWSENMAEFGAFMMLEMKANWELWVSKAKEGSFIGLRTMLLLMEILAFNSEDNQIPIYRDGVPVGHSPVQMDSNRNITMFDLDGLRYHFTYTSDSLLIATMTIKNIATGAEQFFENPAVGSSQKIQDLPQAAVSLKKQMKNIPREIFATEGFSRRHEVLISDEEDSKGKTRSSLFSDDSKQSKKVVSGKTQAKGRQVQTSSISASSETHTSQEGLSLTQANHGVAGSGTGTVLFREIMPELTR